MEIISAPSEILIFPMSPMCLYAQSVFRPYDQTAQIVVDHSGAEWRLKGQVLYLDVLVLTLFTVHLFWLPAAQRGCSDASASAVLTRLCWCVVGYLRCVLQIWLSISMCF